MAITIEQKPSKLTVALTDRIIYTVSDSAAVAGYVNVRFYCEVQASSTDSTNFKKIATLKTTPNSGGMAIFDIRKALEAELSADREIESDSFGAEFQGQSGSTIKGTPIHFVDMFSTSDKASLIYKVKFYVRGAATSQLPVGIIGADVEDVTRYVFNYVPSIDTPLYMTGDNYHTDLDELKLYQNSATSKFLTDAPTTQNIRRNDYMTFAFQQGITNFNDVSAHGITKLRFNQYNGNTLEATQAVTCTGATGGHTPTAISDTRKMFLFGGVGPANIAAAYGLDFTNTTHYTVNAEDTQGATGNTSQVYTFNVIDDCDYESVRLTWLNKYGAWDYYNFNMKSVRSIETRRETYQSFRGDWNSGTYKFNGHTGGSTVYRIDGTEKVTINTDYINEEESLWLESVMSSPEVYIIKETSAFEFGDTADRIRTASSMIEPVMVVDTKIQRLTSKNDKIMIRKFTLQKSRNQNLQRR